MRIKSYFAATVDEAMDKARRELGSEAMLMNSKKTELELRSLGAYEVVFAVPPETERVAAGLGVADRLERMNPKPRWRFTHLKPVHDMLHGVEAARW